MRDKAEDRFQTFFEREVHRLHNNVREESEVSCVIISSSCFLPLFFSFLLFLSLDKRT